VGFGGGKLEIFDPIIEIFFSFIFYSTISFSLPILVPGIESETEPFFPKSLF